MRFFGRFARGMTAILFFAVAFPRPGNCAAFQSQDAPSQNASDAEASAKAPAGTPDARAMYQALNALRPDGAHVYKVHELNLRRDVVSLTFQDGELAFFPPLYGRVTGAVFTGLGHIVATPRDAGERRSLAQFLGVPLLDQGFQTAYLRFTDNTAEEIEKDLAGTGTKPTGDSPFMQGWEDVLHAVNPWHSLRILEDLLSSDSQPYFYAGLGGSSSGAFDVLIDSRREEQVLIGQPRSVNGEQIYNVWASFAATQPPFAREADAAARAFGGFKPLDYRVYTSIGNDLLLTGKTKLHVQSVSAGQRVISLELSRNLSVDGVKLEDGSPLLYFQNEDLNRREIERRGNNSLLVVLPAKSEPGKDISLEVSYHGRVISDAGNGVAFVGERDDWYAHIAGSIYFVPFDLTFHWPKRLTLVATGDEVESHEEGDTKEGHWVSREPFGVAGFNVGEYRMEDSGAASPDIRVYANQQLENSILARLGKGSAVISPYPGLGSSHGNLSLPPQSAPSPSSVLKHLGAELSDSVVFFGKLNGAFPFSHLDVAQIPGSFGQGWPELIYLSTYAYLPAETQREVGLNQASQELAREIMPFHEVVHQWWGNVTAPASYRDIWIEEAMANYQAMLYADARQPGSHRMEKWLERYRAALVTRVAGASETPEEAGPLDLGFRLQSSKDPGAYEAVVYGKGTWVMRMLYEMLREPREKDPDARFHSLLQSVLSDYRFRTLSTADFQKEVEKVMTPEMDMDGTKTMSWFFDEWVRGTELPTYSVEFSNRLRGREFIISGTLHQSGVEDVFTAPVPLVAQIAGGKLEPLGVVVTTGEDTPFRFVSRYRARRLEIDPNSTVLCLTK